ncbi:MAG: DNA adenine methylase [Candidatus Palauibacterales bacterium]|nr:DNA adenine methylase [Candidatus Palauibacterales bacterium]MDP2530649.1 DNA adenine methylase [Candidatus Palauibacterales bacterium]MDP2583552.1 DNA adenine methylase [Candidatus Palauibacterales bacterium]
MRFLGNKTRLLPFLLDSVEALGIEPGVACDPFAGTASVGRALKLRGWRVHAGDLLACSYALQVARVELDRTPGFRVPARLSYSALLERLEALEPRHGFVTEHYTTAGEAGARHGRMYFTPENARRIDAVRERVGAWGAAGYLDEAREQLLLATLIEAADRVANTTGVYASFVKTLQPNAVKPLELRAIRSTPARNGSAGCTASRGAAADLLAERGSVDLVYLDPPYNERQYPAYYHIPELLAEGWGEEPELRGKTGLIPDEDRRSDWCRRRECEDALRTLLEAADARHLLLSYNDEGLLESGRIESALRAWGDPDSYDCLERPYRRYRSDGDGPNRRYARDRVRERLHYARGR